MTASRFLLIAALLSVPAHAERMCEPDSYISAMAPALEPGGVVSLRRAAAGATNCTADTYHGHDDATPTAENADQLHCRAWKFTATCSGDIDRMRTRVQDMLSTDSTDSGFIMGIYSDSSGLGTLLGATRECCCANNAAGCSYVDEICLIQEGRGGASWKKNDGTNCQSSGDGFEQVEQPLSNDAGDVPNAVAIVDGTDYWLTVCIENTASEFAEDTGSSVAEKECFGTGASDCEATNTWSNANYPPATWANESESTHNQLVVELHVAKQTSDPHAVADDFATDEIGKCWEHMQDNTQCDWAVSAGQLNGDTSGCDNDWFQYLCAHSYDTATAANSHDMFVCSTYEKTTADTSHSAGWGIRMSPPEGNLFNAFIYEGNGASAGVTRVHKCSNDGTNCNLQIISDVGGADDWTREFDDGDLICVVILGADSSTEYYIFDFGTASNPPADQADWDDTAGAGACKMWDENPTTPVNTGYAGGIGSDDSDASEIGFDDFRVGAWTAGSLGTGICDGP